MPFTDYFSNVGSNQLCPNGYMSEIINAGNQGSLTQCKIEILGKVLNNVFVPVAEFAILSVAAIAIYTISTDRNKSAAEKEYMRRVHYSMPPENYNE